MFHMLFWVVTSVLLDQLTKLIVMISIEPGETIGIVGDILMFSYVENTGISFGMFQGYTNILIPLVLVIMVVVTIFALRYARQSNWLGFAFGSIIGGALGNQIDRLFSGAVVDFIYLKNFAVFNVADSFITIGAIVLGVSVLFYKEDNFDPAASNEDGVDWQNGESIFQWMSRFLESRAFNKKRTFPEQLTFLLNFLLKKTDQNAVHLRVSGDAEPDQSLERIRDEIRVPSTVTTENSNKKTKSSKPLIRITDICYDKAYDLNKNNSNTVIREVNLNYFGPSKNGISREEDHSLLNQVTKKTEDNMNRALEIKPDKSVVLKIGKKEKRRDNKEMTLTIDIIQPDYIRDKLRAEKKHKSNQEGDKEMQTNDLCLEILTEELPPSEINQLLSQLYNGFSDLMETNRIKFSGLKPFFAARRFGIYASGLDDKQDDGVELKRGPARNIAYNEDGTPAKPLLGFMKGNQATEKDIEIKEENGREYCYINRTITGQTTDEVLKTILPKFLNSLTFKKPMKWGEGNNRFVRPVHNVLAVYKEHVIPFTLMEKEACARTRGHRFDPVEINIDNAGDYFNKMLAVNVISDQEKRRQFIKDKIEALEDEKGIRIPIDSDLLDEVVALTEYPEPVIGKIDTKYLDLPDEVLKTTLKHHQKTFPVYRNNQLQPSFLSFKDNFKALADNVVKGYRKVIEARLADAEFYFKEDVKETLESRLEKLKNTLFQRGLGSLYEKVRRVEKLSSEIGRMLEITPEGREQIERAALLSKSDLTTNMVYEFAELQGVMGRIYAARDGEPTEVCMAIEEQYQSTPPETCTGSILSIGDKLDTVVGNLYIGNIPSGSKDPYGLRRSVNTILTILTDREWDLDLQKLYNSTMEKYNQEYVMATQSAEDEGNQNTVFSEYKSLFQNRIEALLGEMTIEYDVINAVNHLWKHPFRALLAARAISALKEDEGFLSLSRLFERVHNISAKHDSFEYDSRLFEQEEERELENRFNEVREIVSGKLERFDYKTALEDVRTLREAINNYFDNVFVMTDQEDLKLTRLGFLKNLDAFLTQMGDLSQIIVSDSPDSRGTEEEKGQHE